MIRSKSDTNSQIWLNWPFLLLPSTGNGPEESMTQSNASRRLSIKLQP